MRNKRVITIFYDGSHYIFRWLKALLACKSEFSKRNIVVRFANIREYFLHKCDLDILKKSIESKEYDIVFLAFHHDSELNKKENAELRIEILQSTKKHCKKLVWLDTADSTGTTQFEVLPYVDRYLKKQVLKDLSQYKKQFYGARPHCDYYYLEYQLEDENIANITAAPLDFAFVDKIGVSWNVALGDLYANGGVQYLFPFWRKAPQYMNCNLSEKELDTHFRGSAWSPVAGWQRRKCIELLKQYTEADLKYPDPATKVAKKEYISELKNSKSVISPYGWGEICGRDFECFAYGAVLIKPDMDHMLTYPDWYIKNETYLALDWDMTNFHEGIDMLKDDTKKMQQIAHTGQNLLRKHLGAEGRKLFVEHIIKEIQI